MSIHRRAAKVDNAQEAVVKAGRDEGWVWYPCRMPCDGLWWHPVLDVVQWCEIKTGRNKDGSPKLRNEQEAQRKFLRCTGCPVVTTPEELLEVLRAHYPAGQPAAELIAWAQRLKSEFDADWKRDQANAVGARQRVEFNQAARAAGEQP